MHDHFALVLNVRAVAADHSVYADVPEFLVHLSPAAPGGQVDAVSRLPGEPDGPDLEFRQLVL